MKSLPRRHFLQQASFLSAGLAWPGIHARADEPAPRWRAAIIGCTRCGDYGHGLDVAFQEMATVKVVAVADPDGSGRARAAARSGAARQYADYRAMLAKERPDLVVIAPRWSEEHHAMAMAALESGAHILSEKPLTTTLAEADEILDLARRLRRKVAVAHQMRLSPNVVRLRAAVRDGLIGDVVHIRTWGKQDARAGGEDMLVLGTHLFDMLRFFVGDAAWCGAQVLHQGQPITRAHGRAATEKIGLIAGDEIEAQFGFEGGVTASFTSRARLRETLGPWAVELLGSRGAMRIQMDIDPSVWQRRREPITPAGVQDRWLPWTGDPPLESRPEQRGFGPANRRVVANWLHAIEHDDEPECGGRDAMKAMEMIMAVYQAALSNRRITLPMANRQHPLA